MSTTTTTTTSVLTPPPSSTKQISYNDSIISLATHLFATSAFSDCAINSHKSTWHLHRAILAPRCSFFAACFAGGFSESTPTSVTNGCEINMQDDDPEALGRMLKWLYTMEYPYLSSSPDLSFEMETSSSPDQSSSQGNEMPSVKHFQKEMALFTIADKYDLPALAMAVMDVVCAAAKKAVAPPEVPTASAPSAAPQSPSEKHDTSPESTAPTTEMSPSILTVLSTLYLHLPPTSPSVRLFRTTFLHTTLPIISKLVSHDSNQTTSSLTTDDEIIDEIIQDLIAEPDFVRDLVGLLAEEADAERTRVREREQEARSRRDDRDVLGDDAVNGTVRGEGGRVKRPCYVPMNEDSDVDD